MPLKIEGPSQELIIEMFQTAPNLHTAHMELAAEGVFPPYQRVESWWEGGREVQQAVTDEYVEECDQLNIIPFSKANLLFRSSQGMFITSPKDNHPDRAYQNISHLLSWQRAPSF